MKIRTDFVTNSSSSSFVVKITLLDTDGNTYDVSIPTRTDCAREICTVRRTSSHL